MDSVPVWNFAETHNQDVNLARDGDKKAFERLMVRHNDSMYRIALSMLKNKQDIEDAYQNTVIKCYRSIRKLKNHELFKTWLIRILINECNDILKHRKKVILTDELTKPAEAGSDYSKLELTEAVNKLEAGLRIVTLLYYYEDMPQKRIAEILRIPEGTVASRLSRARSKLLESLKEV